MKYLDQFGQETTIERSGLGFWDSTQKAFLAHAAPTADHLAACLQTDPTFALGHCVKGYFLLLLGKRELRSGAREALAKAQAIARDTQLTSREQHYIDGLHAWIDGRPSGAIAQLDTILAEHPTDTLAMKLSHAIRFLFGDLKGMRRQIEEIRPAYRDDHPGFGYLLGCHAFALEETGDYALAAATGRAALDHAPDDAWGLHAVAHVHEMTCNPRAGLEWLEGREQAWSHCNNFRYHVWWHKALMHLDLGEIDAVLDLYDGVIRAEKTDDYRDIANATSLLMRLELEQVDVGARWDELADLSEARIDDGSLIFADLHYLLALSETGRVEAADALVERIAADGARCAVEGDKAMLAPGSSAARGVAAFGEGEFDAAFGALTKARPFMQRAGGSHAQRDVFERLAIDAGIRSGNLEQALEILDERSSLRSGHDDHYAATRRQIIRTRQQDLRLQA